MADEKRLIYAQEPIRRLSAVCVTDDSIGMGIKMGLNHAIQTINDIPSVDAVEAVHGRWISKECKPHLIYKCSECGDVWSYGAIIQMKYCPNCGAKMDGDGNDKGESYGV